MIFLKLFLTFLKIGAVSFGGGYGMISLIRDDCLANGWLTEEELLNYIAVAESTPGPIAVNMATFVGSSQGGILGALVATLGIVLPSFLIILLIAAVMQRLLRYAPVKAFLSGLRPTVIALILSTALLLLIGNVLGIDSFSSAPTLDVRALAILSILILSSVGYRTLRRRALSPILVIVFSAALGVLLYGTAGKL